MVPSAAEIVDHAFQAIAAAGIIYTGIRAHLAARNSKEAKEVAEETHRQVRASSHSKTTAKVIEESNGTVAEIRNELTVLCEKFEDFEADISAQIKELLAEQAALGVAIGAHLVDDHDPIKELTRRRNRRFDDPKEY